MDDAPDSKYSLQSLAEIMTYIVESDFKNNEAICALDDLFNKIYPCFKGRINSIIHKFLILNMDFKLNCPTYTKYGNLLYSLPSDRILAHNPLPKFLYQGLEFPNVGGYFLNINDLVNVHEGSVYTEYMINEKEQQSGSPYPYYNQQYVSSMLMKVKYTIAHIYTILPANKKYLVEIVYKNAYTYLQQYYDDTITWDEKFDKLSQDDIDSFFYEVSNINDLIKKQEQLHKFFYKGDVSLEQKRSELSTLLDCFSKRDDDVRKLQVVYNFNSHLSKYIEDYYHGEEQYKRTPGAFSVKTFGDFSPFSTDDIDHMIHSGEIFNKYQFGCDKSQLHKKHKGDDDDDDELSSLMNKSKLSGVKKLRGERD